MQQVRVPSRAAFESRWRFSHPPVVRGQLLLLPGLTGTVVDRRVAPIPPCEGALVEIRAVAVDSGGPRG